MMLLTVVACGSVTRAIGPIGEELPPYLEGVHPADGAVVSNEELDVGTDRFGGVCAHFNFQKRFSPAPQKRVRLYLDGADITSQAGLRGTTDYPMSSGMFCYTPQEPLAEGWHEARVVYQDVEGNRYSYRWRFQVQDPPDYVPPTPRPTIPPRTPAPTATPVLPATQTSVPE